MPLIVLILMFVCYIAVSVAENSTCKQRSKPLTSSDLNELSRLMIGMSQAECKQLLRAYKKD